MLRGFFAHDRLKQRARRRARSVSLFAGEDRRSVLTTLTKVPSERSAGVRLIAPLAKVLRAFFVGVHRASVQHGRYSFPQPSRNACSDHWRMLSPTRR